VRPLRLGTSWAQTSQPGGGTPSHAAPAKAACLQPHSTFPGLARCQHCHGTPPPHLPTPRNAGGHCHRRCEAAPNLRSGRRRPRRRAPRADGARSRRPLCRGYGRRGGHRFQFWGADQLASALEAGAGAPRLRGRAPRLPGRAAPPAPPGLSAPPHPHHTCHPSQHPLQSIANHAQHALCRALSLPPRMRYITSINNRRHFSRSVLVTEATMGVVYLVMVGGGPLVMHQNIRMFGLRLQGS
jgi:hypothetical protein